MGFQVSCSSPFATSIMADDDGSSRTKGERSRALGWAPSKTLEDFRASFDDEW